MKIVFFTVLLLLALGVSYYFFRPHADKIVYPSPTSSSKLQKGDINHDGKVDYLDDVFITNSLNCKKSDPCWNAVVGKTTDGYNPIYTSDIDLNNDGMITNLDLPSSQ